MKGNGKAPAEDPEGFNPMPDTRPQHEESWVTPVRSADGSVDSILLSSRKKNQAVDPKVGVDPSGFKSHFARALAVGNFTDPEAYGAFATFSRVGALYLNTNAPPWLCSQLRSDLLTPLAKDPWGLEY